LKYFSLWRAKGVLFLEWPKIYRNKNAAAFLLEN